MPARPVSRDAEPPLLQVPQSRLRTQKSMPELSRYTADSPPPSPFNATPVAPAATFGPGVSDRKWNFVQNAFSEARHFAGGLIPHPTESTKHYTVLRHSPPLIFYRGASTSVAITIFSSPDHPLPADRTLWLVQRGYSGDSGMKIKAFFNATDEWLHVTPSTETKAHQVAPDSERAWQRDIGKATKKLLKEKGPKKAHVARETHVIRVPEASDDGYFRLILCTGRGTPFGTSETSGKCKTLCTSPIFRVASTSTDSSVFRGASLTTLPLEMGVFVGSVVASVTVDRYIGPVRDPIEDLVDSVRPGLVAETVGGLVNDEVSEWSAERNLVRDQAWFAAHQTHVTRSLEADSESISPIGPDSGPEAPFPVKFHGKVVRGTGRSQAELGIPTANLSGVADEVQYRLNGTYFGWACVQPKKEKEAKSKPTRAQTLSPDSASTFDLPSPTYDPASPTFDPPPSPACTDPESQPEWHEAVITIAPSPSTTPSVTPKPLVAVHLLNQSPDTSLLGHTIKVIALGLLRPAPPPLAAPPPLKERLDAVSRDICLTLVSLAREHWAPGSGAVAVELKKRKSDRGLGARIGDVREKIVGKVVPASVAAVSGNLHRVGVRGWGAEERDRWRGEGGYWVRR